MPTRNPSAVATLDSTDTTGDYALRLQLIRNADRYSHHIQLHQPDGSAAEPTPWSWQTMEGDGQQDWPHSPPLQDFSLEHQSGTAMILAVGMAGHSHWSASIEALRSGFQFDIACRLTFSPPWQGEHWLGTTYDIGSNQPAMSSPTGIDTWQAPLEACGISAANSIEVECDSQGETACEVLIQDNSLKIRPVSQPRTGQTLRWRYRIQLAPAPA